MAEDLQGRYGRHIRAAAGEYEIQTTMRSAYGSEQHRLYLFNMGIDQCDLTGLDSMSGKAIWQSRLGGVKPDTNVSLMLQAENLFVLAGDAHKLNAATGTVIWKRSLSKDFDNPKR